MFPFTSSMPQYKKQQYNLTKYTLNSILFPGGHIPSGAWFLYQRNYIVVIQNDNKMKCGCQRDNIGYSGCMSVSGGFN